MNIFRTLIDKNMKKTYSVILLLYISIVTCSCQVHCDLKGKWLIKEGTLSRDFRRSGHLYSRNRVEFFRDRLELASGFSYNILPWDSVDWGLGRYPFVYYGNIENYRIIEEDTLQIYSKPYDRWESFKIECTHSDEIRLRTARDTVILVRDRNREANLNCSIKTIKAHVYEQGLGLFANDYKVTYSRGDNLIFQQLSDKDPHIGTKIIQLKAGTFEDICKGLSQIDLSKLKYTYTTDESEAVVKDIEIELVDGKNYKFHLENDDYPEELMLAIIPVLYGHQQYVYGHLPAVK